MQKHLTRESWLVAAVEMLRPIFDRVCSPLPDTIRVTMSLTKGKRILAVCYDPVASEDSHTEILIRISEAEPVEVLDHLTHELVHAAVGCKEGHEGMFKKVALAIGLEGRMKSASAGHELRLQLEAIASKLGAFPHAVLNLDGATSSGPRRQSTRMKKCTCRECGYTVRLAKKWLEIGLPHCADISHGRLTSEENADQEKN